MEGKETNTNQNMSLSDIGTIRNILMGQQIAEFEERFQILKEEFSNDMDQMKNDASEMKAHFQNRLQEQKEQYEEQITRLTSELEASNKELQEKIDSTSNSDRSEIGKLLMDIGKQISGK